MRYTTIRSRERTRRRNALLLRLAKYVILIVAIIGIGYSSYESGLWLAERKVVGLREELAATTRKLEDTERARDEAQARLAKANDEIRAGQRKYDTDVPTGAPADLLKLAKERLAAGLSAERLADAMRSAQASAPCEGRPLTRRFALRTGTQAVPEDTTSFFDGFINLQASIQPGEDANRGVSVVFTRPNAPPVTATGKLPLRQSIFLDNSELRFTIAASDLRGYVTATVNACGR
jgi:hypothetical protein